MTSFQSSTSRGLVKSGSGKPGRNIFQDGHMVHCKSAGYHGLGDTVQHRINTPCQLVVAIFDVDAVGNLQDQSGERTTRHSIRLNKCERIQ